MPSKYVATVPQVFDLWQDPQERYDIFMNNFTECTWTIPAFMRAYQNIDEDLHQVSTPQAAERGLYGPITISNYEKFQWLREQLKKDGFNLSIPGQ